MKNHSSFSLLLNVNKYMIETWNPYYIFHTIHVNRKDGFIKYVKLS